MTRKTNSRTSRPRYLVCVDNHAYPAALERWKLYQVLPDPHALQRSLVRIIDESGEDYLYPASLFAPIPVPKAIRAAMAS